MLRRPSAECVLVIEFSKDAGAAHGIGFEDRGMWPFPDLMCLRQIHVAVSRVDRDSKAAELVEPGMEILSINGAEALKAWHCDSAIRKAGGIVALKVRKPPPTLGILGWLGVSPTARLPWTRRKLTVEIERGAEDEDLGVLLAHSNGCWEKGVEVWQVAADGRLDGVVQVKDQLTHVNDVPVCSHPQAGYLLKKPGKHRCALLRARTDGEVRQDALLLRLLLLLAMLCFIAYIDVPAIARGRVWPRAARVIAAAKVASP